MNTDRVSPWNADPKLRARIAGALGTAAALFALLPPMYDDARDQMERFCRVTRRPSRGRRIHVRRVKAAERRRA